MNIGDLRQTKDTFAQNLTENAYINMCTTTDMEIAIAAIEKQIPKKAQHSDVIVGLKSVIFQVCEGRIFYLCSYCYHCGQKLDWGKEQ